jgi:hypothetical protein
MTSHLIPLVCALALPGLAQSAQPGTSRPSFQSGADVVTLDLIVRDKKGRPVRDLARATSRFTTTESRSTSGTCIW